MNYKALGLSVLVLSVVLLFALGLVLLATYSKTLAMFVVLALGLWAFYQCFKGVL